VTGRVDPSLPAAAIPAAIPAAAPGAVPAAGTRGSVTARFAARWRRPRPPSPARRFLLANLAILVIGGLLIGIWVGDLLERGIVDRTASITALYVESFIEPQVDALTATGTLAPEEVAQLDSLLGQTSLGDRIVSLRIWSPDGTVAYSPDPSLIGRSFPVEGGLAEALTGQVVAERSDLQSSENILERGRFDHLLEMYVPVRQRGSDRIIAVAEFYQLPEELDREVANARLETWILVGVGVLVSVLLLYGIVRQASATIDRQQTALRQQVGELSSLLAQNAALHQRVSNAAARTTTLNERSMRRIGADLHDGPAQMLSLALLRLDAGKPSTTGTDATTAASTDATTASSTDQAVIQGALQDALREMRAIASGLRLPELESASIPEVAERAIADHRRRTGAEVEADIDTSAAVAPLSVRIALFRALQELLSNATRHGAGTINVGLHAEGTLLRLDVADEGPGFDLEAVGGTGHLDETGHLGLAGVREQAELLGGRFAVERDGHDRTVIRVWWPVTAGDAGPRPANGAVA
jgi:signal transduction histidine kinase